MNRRTICHLLEALEGKTMRRKWQAGEIYLGKVALMHTNALWAKTRLNGILHLIDLWECERSAWLK